MKDVKIIKFNNAEEYKLWLSEQSYHVYEKAMKFKERFGNVVPIVIELCADTSAYAMGCEHTVHIFVNPSAFETILENVVFEGGVQQ